MTAVGIVALIGCSDANLYQPQVTAQGTANINFCTTPSTTVVNDLKYLFVTDISGSNQHNFTISGPGATPVPDTATPPGTDPTGQRRYQGLVNFLQNSTAQSNVYYAGLFFAATQTVPFGEDSDPWYTGGGGNPAYLGAVPNTASGMAANYLNIWCPGGETPPACAPTNDLGYTDYIGTLTLVKNSIMADVQRQQYLVQHGQPLQASSYVIFWTSDGFPYVASGAENVGTIIQLVQDIMNLKTSQQYGQYINSITFNTAFYFTTSTGTYEFTQAENIMTEMATIGQGNFVYVQQGQDIDYTKFAVPTQNPPFVLRDLWIHDASAVWWNGKLMLDTDNDGIPDKIEQQWGSNPNAYDSDQNGVGDGVEYYLYGTPCSSISSTNLGQTGQSCTTAGAKNVSALLNCGSPGTYPNVYPDTDLDYLNDCEETLLGSSYTDFDSNQDDVPDQLEWLYNIPYVFGTNGLTADPADDGVDDYAKLKELFPINTPVPQLHGVVPLAYTITTASSNSTQTCYNVNVQSISTMSSSDVLRVYIMESEGAEGTSLRHMRVLKNITHMTGSTISLTDGDFTP